MDEVDVSPSRLGADRIDLRQIRRFDLETHFAETIGAPAAEAMQALFNRSAAAV